MNSQEMDCLLKNDIVIRKKYTNSIYSYDELPEQLMDNKFYICNTKSSTHDYKSLPGHWICYLNYTTALVYVDSLALYPEPQFLPSMLSLKKPIFYLNLQLQNWEKSTSCGLHCLTWVTCFAYDLYPDAILNYVYKYDTVDFSKNPYFYDKRASEFVQCYFGESRPIFYDP